MLIQNRSLYYTHVAFFALIDKLLELLSVRALGMIVFLLFVSNCFSKFPVEIEFVLRWFNLSLLCIRSSSCLEGSCISVLVGMFVGLEEFGLGSESFSI